MTTKNGRNIHETRYTNHGSRVGTSAPPPVRPVGFLASCWISIQSSFEALFGPAGRPGGKKSECAVELAAVAKKHPEYKELIGLIEEVVISKEACNELTPAIIEKKKHWEAEKNKINAELNAKDSELNSRKIRIESLMKENTEKETQLKLKEEQIVSAQERCQIAEGRFKEMNRSLAIISDSNLRAEYPIRWGQALDTVWNEMPAALDLKVQKSNLYPDDFSPSLCTLKEENRGGRNTPTRSVLFVAAKEERGMARWSEDRVGFKPSARGYRAVAIDGVGGSTHPRHLVRELGNDILALDGIDIPSMISSTLRRVGSTMSKGAVAVSENEKMAFFQQQRLKNGAACVLAVAEYESEAKTVKVHQIGDTVAFVELAGGKWDLIPGHFAGGDNFDSSPEQLNCLNPDSVRKVKVQTITDATGRVALATDGVAEYILKNGGIDAFLKQINKHVKSKNDGKEFLMELRKKGIAEDDLSFILIEPK